MSEQRELVLTVTGMDCTNCAASVEQGVSQVAGVERCAVTFTSEQLRVNGTMTREDVVRRVRELGYDAHEPQTASEPAAAPGNLFHYLWQRRDTRFALAAALLIVPGIFVTELGGVEHWAINAAAVVALALTAPPVVRSGWQNLRINRNLNINALMTIAAVGALFIGAYMEAAMVMVLFVLGEAMEGYSAGNARHAIRSLMEVAPNTALRLVRAGNGANSGTIDEASEEEVTEEEVPVDRLNVDDVIVIKPGDRMPMDGRVIAGQSAINQAPITGESVPVPKGIGDEVFAGSINGDGALEVQVTHLAADNTISRIIRLVQEAQESQAPTQRFIDRFAAVYTPAVVLIAALVAVGPPLVLGQPFFNPHDGSFGWLYRGLALLVVACPCALVISTPVSIISGLSNGARNGILIKGGAFLERLSAIKVFAFDKTGTLTNGQPMVVNVRTETCAVENGAADQACPNCDDLIALASAVEARSQHPFAQAVVGEASRRQVHTRYAAGKSVAALTGRGVHGTVNGRAVLVGSHAHFDAQIAHSGRQCSLATDDAQRGLTPLMVSVDGDYRGTITVADTLRASSRAAIADLRQAGVRVVAMLTGDAPATANAIASQIGVTDVRAGLAPGDKSAVVAELRQSYGPTAMVGDGINDAPALAAADVGIAIGAAHGGTAQALETADVVLMSDDLRRLGYAYRLSRATLNTVRANVLFSIGLKLGFIVLVVLGMSTMWMAVAADVGVSLLVTANGLRLLRWNHASSASVPSPTSAGQSV